MEMLIFGNRTKRDLFTRAFSDFMKENMMRDVQDKRDNWEDDMTQLMVDALGNDDGIPMVREIFADPKRMTLFREAFAGYLEERPSQAASLMETDEGLGTDEQLLPQTSRNDDFIPSSKRDLPLPV